MFSWLQHIYNFLQQFPLLAQAFEHLQNGGGVMWPLMILSIWMWALIILKLKQFYAYRKQEGSIKDCLSFAEGNSFPGAAWQKEIVTNYLNCRCHFKRLDRQFMDRLRTKQEKQTERFIPTILVLASVAPLLGLLGTVEGMITTFQVISQFGTGNAKAMASGISEALITTQTGLVVAVPGLILGNFLNRRAGSLKRRMECFCLSVLRETEN